MRARFWFIVLLGLPVAGALGYLAAERVAGPPSAPSAAIPPRAAAGPESVTVPRPRAAEPGETPGRDPRTPNADAARAAFEAARADQGDDALARLRLAFVRWLVEDPAAALAHTDELPAAERREVVAAALTLLAQERPDDALGYLGRLDGDYTPYLAGALGEIAKTDPRRALEWVEKNQARDPNGDLYGAVLPALAKVDLARAAQAVESLGDRAPQASVQAVAAEYARRDPARAYAWAAEMAAARHDDPAEGLHAVSASLVAADPARAAQFLAGSSDPAVRGSLIAEISQQRGEQDLPGAWRWLDQFKDEPSYGANARSLLSRWSYAKPQEVADLLQSVTDPELQTAAARELASSWQQQDPARYGAWVASLPPGPLKTAASSVTQ